ncbi:MAG: Biotin carboxyl carrier protein [Clostridiales bacterium]|jgi:biotin carboxyl carrier protein|nr:Biotin carboxyl carrier protein [Clostridiales bacterium]
MKNFIVTVNGNRYDVQVDEVAGGQSTNTVAAPFKTVAPVVKAAPTPSSSGAGKVNVTSPMPGKIVSVKVTVGQKVEKGEIIAVLEAMKMENEVVATSAGTIASVNVTQGQAVESGDIIVTLN